MTDACAVKVSAVLSRDDLAQVIRELTPTRVELRGEAKRVVCLGRPALVELVAGAGLRVRGDARLTWEVAGLALPVTLRAWQVLLVPSVVVRDGASVLAFDPILEELDFKRVPGFLDGRIAEAINDALLAQRGKLAWNFTKTLSVQKPLPERVSPRARFELVPAGGTVVVTSTEVHLEVAFASRVVSLEPALDAREAAERGAPSSAAPRHA